MQNPLLNRKICFVSSRSGFITDEKSFSMDWANGRLIHELSKEFGSAFSVAVFSDPLHNSNYNFPVHASKIYPLPFPFSVVGGIKNIFRINRVLRQIEQENDLLIIQLPFIGFPALLKIKKPTVFHVCANVLTAAQNPFKYKGFTRIVSKLFAQFSYQVNRRLFKRKRNLLIVNGNELGELYNTFNPVSVVSSSIYSAEMISEVDINTRSEHDEFRILFIGRPSKEKGFPTLMQAFINLIDKGNAVSLRLMGVQQSELETILDIRIDKKYLDKIDFLGFIPWSQQFREIVQSSHCLVLSSVSEGTPRVLIEARGLGCPVIATNVGGIFGSIEGDVDGILINPGRPDEVVNAVVSMFDENFRMKLARNGLLTAKRYSLENFVAAFQTNLNALKNEG